MIKSLHDGRAFAIQVLDLSFDLVSLGLRPARRQLTPYCVPRFFFPLFFFLYAFEASFRSAQPV
ncbi:hypothetical protein BIBO2_3125 [Brucella sp. BO2]|nr:hypothetical protein BIBO2_3125 [Brucella sp. BO2]